MKAKCRTCGVSFRSSDKLAVHRVFSDGDFREEDEE